MIRDRRIVCIANHWESDPTGKHHIMTRLALHNDVLWVNYHGTRKPTLNRSDAAAAGRMLRRVFAKPKYVTPRLVHFTPVPLPGCWSGWTGRLHRELLAAQIQHTLARLGWRSNRPLQLWTFAPETEFLAGALGEECLVYYCVDEFSEFQGLDAARIREAEARLLEQCDVVVTTSESLYQSRVDRHPRVHLVRHGVDLEHFGRALFDTAEPPGDIQKLKGPVFGFFGLVDHWVDLELLHDVAYQRPEYQFVLLGQLNAPTESIRKLRNVHLLGRRPYRLLPDYCRCFHAGLIPFVKSAMTRHVNPIKLREYLAAGLPVISTQLPEVEGYAPHVAIVQNTGEFVAALDALATPRTAAQKKVIHESVIGESWEAVVGRLHQLIDSGVRSRREPAHPALDSAMSGVA